jgi:hypothetical protein
MLNKRLQRVQTLAMKVSSAAEFGIYSKFMDSPDMRDLETRPPNQVEMHDVSLDYIVESCKLLEASSN